MNWISMTMNIAGGLALFLYGLLVMTESLKKAATGKLKPFLGRMVSNRWKALAAGAGITALIQSSSVTTVLAVGFVSAGLLQFQQTIGIILGAGIGSTITAQIIAFKITNASLALIAAGFLVSSLVQTRTYHELGQFLLGLGLIFLGMNLMGEGTEPLKNYPPFIQSMQDLDHPVFGLLIGTLFTAIIQSSAATVGVVILLVSNGLIGLNASIAIVLGANIGTCATAILSTIGKPRASLQVAVAHVLFKTIGALAWVAFIPELGKLVQSITPNDIGRQVANAHSIFNVVNALVMIWFTSGFARLVKRIVPDHDKQQEKLIPKLDPYYLQHAGVSLDLAQQAIGKLGDRVLAMAGSAFDTALDGHEKELKKLRQGDEEIDSGHIEIISFIRLIQQRPLIPHEVERINNLVEATNVLESLADLITTNLVEAAEHRFATPFEIDPDIRTELKSLYEHSVQSFADALEGFKQNKSALNWETEKIRFKQEMTIVRNHLIERMSAEKGTNVDIYRFETEIIEVTRLFHGLARRLARKIEG